MASVDVKLTTKFIEVGINPESFYTTYGYNSINTDQVGDCNETANGGTDTTIPNVYGGNDNITRAFHINSSGGGFTYLYLDNDSNSTWSKFRIGSFSGEVTYNRSAATFTDLGTEGRWGWSASTNSYGTTAGNDIPLTIFGTVENALTSVGQPSTSITVSDTSETWEINSGGGASGQRYRILLVSGTNGDGDSANAILQYGTYTGTYFTLTLNNGDLPTSGNTCNYKVQTSTANATFVETESGFWTDCTGTGSTFSITRGTATPSGSISFTGGSSQTEGLGTLGFSFSNTVDGTYYYDVNRISGSSTGGEITNPGPSTVAVSSGTGTVNLAFVNDSNSEIGFQGEDFVMRYGTTSNSQDLDTLNFTLYDDDTGLSYSDSTIDVGDTATSHTVSIVRSTGHSSAAVTARVRNITTNSIIGNTFSLSTGTTARSVADAPPQGNTEAFRIEVYNGNVYVNGPTYTVTTAATPSDTEIDSLSFTDVPTAVGGTVYYASDQLTGINATINVTTAFGTGTRGFYISSSSTPSTTASLYTTAAKTATNNQYVHCRVVASSTPSGSTDITIVAGSPSKSDTFNVTTAQDTSPDNYTFSNATNAGVSTLTVSNVETITGISGNVSVSVSGQGTPRISIDGGSYVSSGTISNGETLQVRLTSSASNSTTHTATVTCGTGTFAQETFAVTTVAASGGGGGGVSGGSSNYGVEVYDTNGTTTVLSPSTRYIVRVTDVTTFSFTANGTANDDVLLTTDMTDLTTANSDVLFLPGNLNLIVTRESGGFRVTNGGNNSFTQTMFAVRF